LLLAAAQTFLVRNCGHGIDKHIYRPQRLPQLERSLFSPSQRFSSSMMFSSTPTPLRGLIGKLDGQGFGFVKEGETETSSIAAAFLTVPPARSQGNTRSIQILLC